MQNELNNFKLDKFKAFLKSESGTEDHIKHLIKTTLSRPDLILIHDIKKRHNRDSFIDELKCTLKDKYSQINNFILEKHETIKISENLFDEIKKELSACDLSNQHESIQVWSHIGKVIAEFKTLKIDSKHQQKTIPKYTLLSPYKSLKNSDGNEYNPDSILEVYIQYLTITLLLLSHKHRWFSENIVIIPSKVNVDETNIDKAEEILRLAMSWKSLEKISQQCISFDGKAYRLAEEEVPSEYKEHGLKHVFVYEREESTFETYDAIACERVRKKHLQNLLELNSSAGIKSTIAPSFSKLGKINEFSFISIDEVHTCQYLSEVLCTDILTGNVELNNLELFNWIRGYYIINYLSELIWEGKISAEFRKDEIISYFQDAGIENDKALYFINLISFSKNSQDLFDCPLIKMQDDKYHLAYYAFTTPIISRIILSRLSSLDTQISEKGYRFERETRNLITKKLSPCKEFKFRRGSDEYEYDGVFIVDKKIFLLECKNRSLSWYNPVKTYRNKNYMLDTLKQIERLKNALIQHPDVIKEHFNVDVSQYEIIPVIYNCMPFSWKGKINGVYITDNSAFSRFLKSKRINLVTTTNKGQRHEPQKKLSLWSGKKPNSDDIVRQLEKPIQLTPYLNSRKKSIYPRWISKESMFCFTDYEVDADAYKKEEIKLFSTSKKRLR